MRAAGREPDADGAEIVDARWFSRRLALAATEPGSMFMVFPTIKHLEQSRGFASADGLLDHARHRTCARCNPGRAKAGETARIVLPGEPGYDG